MAAPRKTTSARRASKAAVEAQASTAAVDDVPVEDGTVADQLPLVEEVAADAPEAEQGDTADAPEAEQGDTADAPEVPLADIRASMLAKFVTPDAVVAEPEPEAPVAVQESGRVITLPAGDTRALVTAVCTVELFTLRTGENAHQLYKGDTVTGPAELLARGIKFGALAERG